MSSFNKKCQRKALKWAQSKGWGKTENLAFNNCKNPEKNLCQRFQIKCNRDCWKVYNQLPWDMFDLRAEINGQPIKS